MEIKETIDLSTHAGGFHKLLGINKAYIDSNDEFYVVVELEEKHSNFHGIAHGGYLYTLCDSAIGVYAYTFQKKAVTLDGHINYYRPAIIGETLVAKVIPRKKGKTVSSYICEVRNKDEKLIVEMVANMYHS